MREVLDYTERMTAPRSQRIPDGELRGDDYADTDGFIRPDPSACASSTVQGDEIDVDFSGTDQQCIGSINSPYANTASAIYYCAEVLPQSGRAGERGHVPADRRSSSRENLAQPGLASADDRMHDARLVEDLRGHLAGACAGDPRRNHRADVQRVQLVCGKHRRP